MSTPFTHSAWTDGLADICVAFQLDLSALVDGELDEAAAGRAMLHLEGCKMCRDFFDDTRTQIRLHKDLQQPDRIVARLATLTGGNILDRVAGLDLVHRLSSVFYQLGKAYALTAIDPDYRERLHVFEEAVPVDSAQRRGRGFVDGVLMSEGDGAETGGVDWRHARSMLNGRLERIESPLEKGRKLLEEAISVDPSHEEAQLHLANIQRYEGKPLQAARAYREIFDSAIQLENRVHAAVHLGCLHKQEGDMRSALLYWRWISTTGLLDEDDRFWFVRFNIGLAHALAGRQQRAINALRTLLDRHPAQRAEIVQTIGSAEELRRAVDSQPGFAEAMLVQLPELFQSAKTDDVG